MPRPSLLPILDWEVIYQSGLPFDAWIENAESEERAQAMEDVRRAVPLHEAAKAVLDRIPREVYIVAIAEDWCGDVVRHIPVLQAIDDLCPYVFVRYIKREDHLDVFARFLTNGGESIPMVIFLNDQWVECGHWGPMPRDCAAVIARGKACGDLKKAREVVGQLYAADPDRQIVVDELIEMIDIASARSLGVIDLEVE